MHWAGLQRHQEGPWLLHIYHSEKILTHPTPPGLTELVCWRGHAYIVGSLSGSPHVWDRFRWTFHFLSQRDVAFHHCAAGGPTSPCPYKYARLHLLEPTKRSLQIHPPFGAPFGRLSGFHQGTTFRSRAGGGTFTPIIGVSPVPAPRP